MKDLEIRCKDCKRYLGLKGIETIISQVRCPNSQCKAINNVKVVDAFSTDEQIRYTFPTELEQHQASLKKLEAKLVTLDGRTKEAKELSARIEEVQSKIASLDTSS